MLGSRYKSALTVIVNHLSNKDVIWALTGSTSFIIQGMPLSPSDIDIQTDKTGAYAINGLLKAYEKEPVAFSSTDTIRSHIGSFVIYGITVEVMGDIQKKYNSAWEKTTDLPPLIEYVVYEDMTLPVLNMQYESAAYRKMGRLLRADDIDRFLAENMKAKTV